MNITRVSRPFKKYKKTEIYGLPYNVGGYANRQFLKDYLSCRPTWDAEQKLWSVARSHTFPAAELIAGVRGQCLVVTYHNLNERCDARCQKAEGDDCQCSCLGRNHGGGQQSGWDLIGETTLSRSEIIEVTHLIEDKESIQYLQRNGINA